MGGLSICCFSFKNGVVLPLELSLFCYQCTKHVVLSVVCVFLYFERCVPFLFLTLFILLVILCFPPLDRSGPLLLALNFVCHACQTVS